MFDESKKIVVKVDDDITININPADGNSADPKSFQKYFVNFWNEKTGHNDCLTFFVSNKLYLLLVDLNLWMLFLQKLCPTGYKLLHYYADNFDYGDDYMYLTLNCNYEIK